MDIAEVSALGGVVDPVARGAARPINNLVFQLGDSREDYGDDTVAGVTTQYVMSIAGWLEGMTGQRVQCPPKYNYGVAGYTTSDVIANTLTLAVNSPAATGILLIGTNDRGGANRTLASSIANITTILDALYAARKTIILISELPRDGITAEQAAIALEFAKWLRTVAFKRPGVVGVDAWAGLSNPLSTDATATRNVAMYKDGAHLNGAGAFAVAKACAPAINAIFPPVDLLVSNNFDRYDATNTPGGNLLTNGIADGTTGTVGTGTYTGTAVPLTWRVDTAAGTGISVALEKGTLQGGLPSEKFTLSGSASSTSATRAVYFTSANFAASLNAGDIIEAMAQMEVLANPGSYNGFSLELVLTDGGGVTTTSNLARDISSTYMPVEAWALPIRTAQRVVPSGVTDARVILRVTFPQTVAQTGVFSFGRVSVRKVLPLA